MCTFKTKRSLVGSVGGIVLIGVVPLFASLYGAVDATLIALLNVIACLVVVALLTSRLLIQEKIAKVGRAVGYDLENLPLESSLLLLTKEIGRKNRALGINLIERNIYSRDELSRALERIVSLSFELLKAESAELALFDKGSGLYHSSIVLGKPFQSDTQAMLAGGVDGDLLAHDSGVIVQPIAFAGTILGTLRVGLGKGRIPSVGDREIVSLLALQTSVAIINLEYTGELMRMKAASEESVKAKTGFLANLSHEIRAPLGIMLNAVELVIDGLCGEINEDQHETLTMVKENGSHLLELMNDVLDYAKVESGKITIEKVEIVVNDLLEDIARVIRTQADAKGHKLLFTPHSEHFTISCDRRHARQMLINLLTNAIKYTPEGGNIELFAERHPGGKVKINVRDTGVGIEASERGKVFAAFERIDHSYSRKQAGAGLGMPLTKRLAEANGGSIDFDSIPQKGSHFWLVFDAIEGSIVTEEHAPAPVQKVDGQGRNILIFGERTTEASLLVRYLEQAMFLVAFESTIDGAVAEVARGQVQLVILDTLQDDTLLEEFIATIRNSSRAKTLPIVLISSHGFVFDIERFLKAGVDRCLIKPISFVEIGSVCRDLIDSYFASGLQLQKGQETKPLRLKSGRTDLLH